MALTKIDDRGLKTPIDLLDNEKIRFGTGNDLEIFHDGSKSIIRDSGTGNLEIQGTNFSIKNAAGDESGIVFDTNGAVELYYDNSKKFETLSAGVRVASGNLYMYDSGEIICGNGNDLKIYHNGSHSYITNSTGDLYLKTAASSAVSILDNNDDTLFRAVDDGAVELYYDNSKKAFTGSTGFNVSGNCDLVNDNDKLQCGQDGDLQLYHDGSNSYIKNDHASSFYIQSGGNLLLEHTNGENYVKGVANGAVELYYDGAMHFYTTAAGAILKRPSGGETQFQITGCEGNAAELRLVSDDGDDNDDFYKLTAKTNHDFAIENFRNGSSWETNLTCTGDGAVDLYHNGTKKFYTDANGATVMGNLAMGSAGDGINFGADSHATGATSELLDDYEEGTFSVSFWASNTNFNTHPTLTTNQGRYTKIGNKVSINGRVVWSNNAGGAAGNIYMDGLPFSQSSNTVYAGVHFGWWHLDAAALDSDEVLGGYINNNTSYIIFVGNHADASAGSTTISVDELMNGKSGDIQFNCTYFTDT